MRAVRTALSATCSTSIEVTADTQRRARIRDRLQLLDDQARKRPRAIGRQVPAERRLISRRLRCPGTTWLPAAAQVDAAERLFELRREFAHDLFEDILERHQTLQVAIFVDDEGDSPP